MRAVGVLFIAGHLEVARAVVQVSLSIFNTCRDDLKNTEIMSFFLKGNCSTSDICGSICCPGYNIHSIVA
jgi:hypothetical protein